MDKKKALSFFAVETNNEISLSFVGGVKAGFPSPTQDYIDSSIDLNKELIKHPSATFIAKVTGDSLKDAGLDIGDLVLVYKSEPFVHGKNGYMLY